MKPSVFFFFFFSKGGQAFKSYVVQNGLPDPFHTNFYLATKLIPLPNKYWVIWVHIKRWSFIGENGGHSVRVFLNKGGSLSERAF